MVKKATGAPKKKVTTGSDDPKDGETKVKEGKTAVAKKQPPKAPAVKDATKAASKPRQVAKKQKKEVKTIKEGGM